MSVHVQRAAVYLKFEFEKWNLALLIFFPLRRIAPHACRSFTSLKERPGYIKYNSVTCLTMPIP
jgi:hypothetical protein